MRPKDGSGSLVQEKISKETEKWPMKEEENEESPESQVREVFQG